jgi:hypothetical protein
VVGQFHGSLGYDIWRLENTPNPALDEIKENGY